MAQLIDTSIFIAVERQRLGIDVLARLTNDEPVAITAITASEIVAGIYYADTEERRRKREEFVESVLSRLPVLSFDLVIARGYARLLVELRKAGHTVGAHDLQIAATAQAHGMEVATFNVRDFGRIPGLVVRQISVSSSGRDDSEGPRES